MSLFNTVLNPLYNAVSWVLLTFHKFWSMIFGRRASGAAWALSIVVLVVRHPDLPDPAVRQADQGPARTCS